MAGAARNRKSRRRQLRVSHQKNWLTGKYAVLETLRAGRWLAEDVFHSEDLDQTTVAEVQRLAEATGVEVQVVSGDRLSELCHSDHHQGLAARMGPYPYDTMESLTTRLAEDSSTATVPLIVICDRIQDTFNFGAILRCCDAVSVNAVIVAESEQAPITPQVARSSSGAVNHVAVVLTENLRHAVQQLSDAGFLIAAASEKSEEVAWRVDLNRPTALIIGSEARGIDPALLEHCGACLRIPMTGRVESLNAAVAAGILLYEIRRQQNAP